MDKVNDLFTKLTQAYLKQKTSATKKREKDFPPNKGFLIKKCFSRAHLQLHHRMTLLCIVV